MMVVLGLLLLVVPLLTFLFLCRNNSRLQKRKHRNGEEWAHLPPGPRGLPLIGSLHQLSPNSPHLSLDRLASIYGPLMYLRLGSVGVLVISSADAAHDAFKGSNDIALSHRPTLYAGSALSYGCKDIVFAPYGDYWRRSRMACVVDLLSPRRVQSFRAVREEEVAAALDLVAHASSCGVVVDFSELMFQLVNDITCRMAFSKKFDTCGREGRLRALLTESQALLGGFCISDYFRGIGWVEAITGMKRRVLKNFQELDKFYDEVIESHLQELRGSAHGLKDTMQASEQEDFVTRLLRLKDDPTYGGAFNCMESIKGILTDIFIAGTDTSAATLVWTMAELIRNPRVLKKVQEEVRSQLDGTNTFLNETTVSKLNYLKLVIKESLRLHPPAPLLVPRESKEAITIRNFIIPPYTRVIVNARAICRDPRYWENPEEFNPERFIMKDQYVDFRGQHLQLIPFGLGRRICPGINFSLSSVEIILANMLCRFDWRLPNKADGEELKMDEAPGITMHMKTPLLVEPFNSIA